MRYKPLIIAGVATAGLAPVAWMIEVGVRQAGRLSRKRDVLLTVQRTTMLDRKIKLVVMASCRRMRNIAYVVGGAGYDRCSAKHAYLLKHVYLL